MALTETDRRLLGRCLERSPGAWRDFVSRFSGLFCHVVRHTAEARSVSLNEADVDDLAADVFAEIVKNDFRVLRKFGERSSLATYLSVIARRVVVRNIVAKRRLELGQTNGSALANGHSEDTTRTIDDADEIESMLEKLPEREAELLRQYHLEGRSYREIGESLDLAENSVGAALSRARKTLEGMHVH